MERKASEKRSEKRSERQHDVKNAKIKKQRKIEIKKNNIPGANIYMERVKKWTTFE